MVVSSDFVHLKIMALYASLRARGFVLFMGLFRNHNERRLRAFWRLLIQLTLFVAGSELLGLMALGVFIPWSATFFAAYALLTLLVALGSVWLAGRFLDRRTFFGGFGLQMYNRGWWFDLAFGLFLGALLMTASSWWNWRRAGSRSTVLSRAWALIHRFFWLLLLRSFCSFAQVFLRSWSSEATNSRT